jgi:hypothetical protein
MLNTVISEIQTKRKAQRASLNTTHYEQNKNRRILRKSQITRRIQTCVHVCIVWISLASASVPITREKGGNKHMNGCVNVENESCMLTVQSSVIFPCPPHKKKLRYRTERGFQTLLADDAGRSEWLPGFETVVSFKASNFCTVRVKTEVRGWRTHKGFGLSKRLVNIMRSGQKSCLKYDFTKKLILCRCQVPRKR